MWLKGSLHIHTTNSEGKLSPEQAYRWYRGKNYDFIAITDHNLITKLDTAPEKDFIMIDNSVELSNFGTNLHMAGIGLKNNKLIDSKDYQEVIDYIIENEGLAIINHPNWMWGARLNQLLKLKNYHGMEIFNAFIRQEHTGSPFALEKWDHLLTRGNKIWGFAVDDLHAPYKLLGCWNNWNLGWIMVDAKKLSKKAILDSIKKGDFYSSTGVELIEYHIDGNKFFVYSHNGEEVIFIGDHGKILKVIDGKKGEIEIDREYKYIRCEVRSRDGIAFTQPVFTDSL